MVMICDSLSGLFNYWMSEVSELQVGAEDW